MNKNVIMLAAAAGIVAVAVLAGKPKPEPTLEQRMAAAPMCGAAEETWSAMGRPEAQRARLAWMLCTKEGARAAETMRLKQEQARWGENSR